MQLERSAAPRRCSGPWALLGALVLAPAASPQSQAVLGRDNAEFARKLFERRQPEMAEDLCTVIEAADSEGASGGLELIAVKLLRIELRLDRAARLPEVKARKDEINSVLADMAAFVSDYPRTTQAEEARNLRPDVLRQLGEALTAALQEEKDPAVVATLREEGKQAFGEAVKALGDRIEQFKDDRSDPDADLQYADRQHMLACYNLARTYYFFALLFSEDDPERQKLLRKAKVAFEDFGLDYYDQLLNFQGMVYQGMCSKELGKSEDALQVLDEAIALRETYGELEDGTFDAPPEAVDIVCSAVLQKVLLLSELGQHAEAVAAAKDYFQRVPDALYALNGLAVLAAQADAELAARDTAGASASATQLTDLDPEGRWGTRGRGILGKLVAGAGAGASLSPEHMIKVAETMIGKGDLSQALDVLSRARELSRGTPAEADTGSASYFLTGAAFSGRRQWHEASLAFDLAHELYPTGATACEALWRAARCYQVLNAEERQPYFRKRYEDRLSKLASQCPKHPSAAQAQFIEGQALEDEQNYPEAVKVFDRIPAGSQAYEEGQFRAANALFLQARALLAKGNADEGKKHLADIEARLKKLRGDIAQALQRNLDAEVQSRLRGLSFASRATLAQIYLLGEVGRAAEVEPLMEGVEQEYAGDAEKLGEAWNLRIQALIAQGQLDQARSRLDALRFNDPDGPGVDKAGGVLARALDRAAVELFEKDPGSTQADELWRQAAQYYLLSLRAQLDGRESLRPDAVDVVATRLYVYGMHFNGVPESCDTFVGWEGGAPKEPQFWEQAASMHEALYKVSPSYKPLIGLGRNLGFLGRWKETVDVYARTFDQENLIDHSTQRFDPSVVAAKPLLVWAYMEWGVAEHMLALAEQSEERFRRAFEIFERVAANTQSSDRLWWQARYYQLRSLVDRGLYGDAKIMVNNIERTTQDFDQGQFGYKERFLAIKAKLK